MLCCRDFQVVDQAPLLRALPGFGYREHADSGGDADDHVDCVGEMGRPRCPLSEHARDTGAEREPRGQAHRSATGTGAVGSCRVQGGKLFDPATADGHADAECDTAEDPSGEQQCRRIRAQGDENRPGCGHRRRGQHDRAATEPIRQRTADEQCGNDSEDVGEQEGVDGDGGESVFEPIHHQQRRELVAAPGHGEHTGGDENPLPGAEVDGLRDGTRLGHCMPPAFSPCVRRMCASTAFENPSASAASIRSVSRV